jgi:hypothetical protein
MHVAQNEGGGGSELKQPFHFFDSDFQGGLNRRGGLRPRAPFDLPRNLSRCSLRRNRPRLVEKKLNLNFYMSFDFCSETSG